MATVREANAADADAIGDVHAETWRVAYGAVLPEAAFDPAARRARWRDYFRNPWPGGVVLVAEDEGEVVGFASVGPCRDEDGTGELFAIYVHPGRWGTGTGRALIERAESALREHGFREAMLWVLEGNERAERSYRAAGWTHDGGRKVESFQGATVAELRYRRPL